MINKKIAQVGAGLAVASVALLGLAGCANASNEESSMSEVVAPTIVDLENADGQTIDIKSGGFVDLTTADTDPADWSAVVEDENVVTFTPGGPDGSAVMNPGLEGKNPGTTKVELTNKTTGAVVTLTVNVS